MPSEELRPALLTAIVVEHSSLVVQILSAEKTVITVPTITNVVQAKCVVMAASVCQCVLLPLQAIQLFGLEVLLPQL